MSCCLRGTDNQKNEEIERYLETERSKFTDVTKLLLLGAGESGKSTFAKQMKIIHLKGFSREERLEFRPIIYRNVITSMRALINGVRSMNLDIGDELLPHVDAVDCLGDYFSGDITPDLAEHITILWNDSSFQEAFQRQNEIQLYDSSKYFFERLNVLSSPTTTYIPTDMDLLKVRNKTTGVVEIDFSHQGNKFKLVDVGGQRSERRKWMHCFQDVTAVLFLVALSEYDLKLYEDSTINRMDESLRLFHQICNSQWFVDTSMILLLNKRDIFEEKIKKVDLNVCFPEYTGGKDYDTAVAFLQDKFMFQNETPQKQIYAHVTCATDTKNVERIFSAVRDTILRKVMGGTQVSF